MGGPRQADLSADGEWDPLSGEFRSIGGVALDRLFSMGQPLLTSAGAGARLFACFAEAKEFLTSITSTELLACVFLDRPRRRLLSDMTSRLEHVGLVIPESISGELGWAASRAGFPDGHATISSVVVARELGALVGKNSIPTTIFKAYGGGPNGSTVGIEAFVPHGVEVRTVNRWVADGVGVHAAIKTKSIANLEVARQLFEAEGYAMPSFMHGKAITNTADESTVYYFDRMHRGRRLRIECSWSPESVW